MSRAEKPDCFPTRTQYLVWHRLARDLKISYCTDCTPEYQKQMLEAGRCRYPGTTFFLDEDGMVEGHRGNVNGFAQSEMYMKFGRKSVADGAILGLLEDGIARSVKQIADATKINYNTTYGSLTRMRLRGLTQQSKTNLWKLVQKEAKAA